MDHHSFTFTFHSQLTLGSRTSYLAADDQLVGGRQRWLVTTAGALRLLPKIERGLGTERARLGTFRGFGTERARVGTFRGFLEKVSKPQNLTQFCTW